MSELIRRKSSLKSWENGRKCTSPTEALCRGWTSESSAKPAWSWWGAFVVFQERPTFPLLPCAELLQQDLGGQSHPWLRELWAPVAPCTQQINEPRRVRYHTATNWKIKQAGSKRGHFWSKHPVRRPACRNFWQRNCYLSITGLNNLSKLLTRVTLFKVPRLSHDAVLPQHNSSVMKWAQFILPFIQFPLSYGKTSQTLFCGQLNFIVNHRGYS